MDRQINPRVALSRELQMNKIMNQLYACTDQDLRLISKIIKECTTPVEKTSVKNTQDAKTSAIFFD